MRGGLPAAIPPIITDNNGGRVKSGEHGAILIYRAQIAGLGLRDRHLRRWLVETLRHEKQHRAAFREAMPQRRARPCRAMAVWSLGGAALGWLTVLMGRDAVLAATAAIERTVHRHMESQASFLDHIDPSLARLLRDILKQEDEHLAFAEAHHDKSAAAARLISLVVPLAMEVLMAISTRGDSLRLEAAIAERG